MQKLIAITLFFFICNNSWSQSIIPDISNLKTKKEQLQRLAVVCDSFNKIEEYKNTLQVAHFATSIIDASDNLNLSLFYYYIASCDQDTDRDSSIVYYEKSLQHARLSKNSKRINTALFDLLYMYINTAGYTTKRDQVAGEINTILDTTSNIAIKGKCYSTLSDYYGSIGWLERELNYRLNNLGLSKAAMERGEFKGSDADSVNLGVSYFNVGDLYEKSNNYSKAQEYYRLAKPLLWDYIAGLCAFYNGMSITYTRLGQIAEAEIYADSLRKLVEQKQNNESGWSDMLDLYLNNADYYLDQRNVAKAMPYLLEAEKWINTKITEPIQVGTFHYTMGKALVRQKKYNEALSHLKKAEAIGSYLSVPALSFVLRELATCYEGLGLWMQSSSYYAKYLPLKDSLDANAAQQSMANAEARFQNKSKQQEIDLQKTQLAFSRKQKMWMLAGIAGLLLIAATLFLFYRNKKKNAEKLTLLNKDLEEANRTKAKLFSIIGHDLRSPISQVYQFLKLQQLNPDALNTEQKNELSNKIQTATGSLLETMEDLLLWSKTQMNEFKTSLQTVEVIPVVETCKQLLQLNSDAKNISYQQTINDGDSAQTDTYFLQTIVRNLLQNAIKASPDNGIINIYTKKRENTIALHIKNDGATFTQENYLQTLSSQENSSSINGIGLRLVDELSKKINATVTFLMPANGGTLVEINLKIV